MTNLFIGLAVGILMGLTGAGGALISIPIFINYFHFDLKSATVISLIIVFLGAFLNLIMQRRQPVYKISFGHFVVGALTAYLVKPWKEQIPDAYISLFLIAVSLYGMFSMWQKKKIHADPQNGMKNLYLKIIISGAIVGLITTLTGLGGALILVPFMIRWFGLSHAQAITTSLFSMTMVSLSSMFLQFELIANRIELEQILLISLGIIIAAQGIVILSKKIPATTLDMIRKILFSGVVVYTCIAILTK
ncbi:MAG: sulfite exporter TauE/SafE family protein [Bacteriovoracaceae bacterium]|nr:sulfite exporter TauE/SafE family protein [Bacteriovoracaceae bacterium]